MKQFECGYETVFESEIETATVLGYQNESGSEFVFASVSRMPSVTDWRKKSDCLKKRY